MGEALHKKHATAWLDASGLNASKQMEQRSGHAARRRISMHSLRRCNIRVCRPHLAGLLALGAGPPVLLVVVGPPVVVKIPLGLQLRQPARPPYLLRRRQLRPCKEGVLQQLHRRRTGARRIQAPALAQEPASGPLHTPSPCQMCTDWCMVGLRWSLHWHPVHWIKQVRIALETKHRAINLDLPAHPFAFHPVFKSAPLPLEHEIVDACRESCSGQPQYAQRQHTPRQSRARLWMKPRASGSCTVSRRAGQLWALSRSRRCLVVSSNTHSPKAKMSMLRVYWFSKLSSGSTAAREHHQFLSDHRPELWGWQPPARSGSLWR